MGPRTTELEEHFAEYTGTRHALAVASGTAALHLICLAAGLGAGRRGRGSLTHLRRHRQRDPLHRRDPDLRRNRGPGVSLALGGGGGGRDHGSDAGDHEHDVRRAPGRQRGAGGAGGGSGLTLLEDAAHGLGGRLDRRPLGTFGLAGAFSFFSNKNLPIGEGGMVVTDDDQIATKVKLLRSHGMTAISWDRQQGHASGYDVVELGFNYRIDEPRATLATARLTRLDSRQRAASDRDPDVPGPARISGGVVQTMPDHPGAEPAHHLVTVLIDKALDRAVIREKLERDGIQTSLHYPPIHRFSIYDNGVSLPVTEEYAARAVTLPLFPSITEEQIGMVVDALRGAVG